MRAGLPVGGGVEGSHGGAFSKFAAATSQFTGRPITFAAATLLIVVWGITGPYFHYSDTWQLVINTGTTIITFLMVFLIQNTQNRDTLALHVKLDELLIAQKKARNELVGIEEESEEVLSEVKKQEEHLAKSS